MSGISRPPTKAAAPRFGRVFDPWNSVALGHQRADTKVPDGWRDNRTRKLGDQLAAGHSGGVRRSDAVGAGSEDYDEKLKVLIPKSIRATAGNSVVDMLRTPGSMVRTPAADEAAARASSSRATDGTCSSMVQQRMRRDGIFQGLVIYVNGSTHPLISDHKLKHLLVEHGAQMSIHLGRRHVTHVVLGRPAGGSIASMPSRSNHGAGGGLAASKIDKEIRRIGGCGIKYVGVEWVLDSVKAGRRLSEAQFSNLKTAHRSQPSISRLRSDQGEPNDT